MKEDTKAAIFATITTSLFLALIIFIELKTNCFSSLIEKIINKIKYVLSFYF